MSSVPMQVFSSLMPKWVKKREEFNDWFCGAAEPGLKGDDPRCEEMISVGIKRCGSMLEPQSNWGTRIWNIILRKLYTPQEERATSVALKNRFEGSFVDQCNEFLALERLAKKKNYMDTLMKGNTGFMTLAIAILLLGLLIWVVCLCFKRKKEKKDQDKKEENEDASDGAGDGAGNGAGDGAGDGDGDGAGDGDGEVKVKKTF